MPWLSTLLRTAAITVVLLWLLGGCARDENQQEVQQQNESVSGGSTGFAEHGEASVDSNEKPLTQQDGLTASSMSTQPTQSTTVDEQSNDEWMTRCVGENRQEAQDDMANGKIGFLRKAPSSSYPNVYVMNSDGSGQIKLTGTKVGDTDEAWGAWSPDGKKIAFTIRPSFSNNIDIYVINPDGTCPANLTGTKRRAETAPSWSPDGEKIAYLRGSSAAGLFTDLYVMQADGANQTRLIEAGDTAEFEVSFRLLAWSPDGKKIAFLRTTTENPASSAPGSAAPASGPSGIYVIKPNGSGLRKLSKGLSYTGLLVWSPDGKKIAFAGTQGAYGGGSIAYVVNADGTERRKLLSSEDSISSLAWSPDGKKIAFSNIIDIYVMNSDGSGQSNLTSTNGIPETAPSWSPSGKQIAFTSGQVYENQDIYVMNTEGTGRTRLAENASSPSFAPRAGEK